MKNIIVVCSLLFVAPVYAGEFYIGGSYGYSNLNYDLEGEAWEYIGTDKTAAQINGLVQTLNGNVEINSNKGSTFTKAFVGYRFNKYIGLEIFKAKMDNYNLKIDANAAFNERVGVGDRHGDASVYAKGDINLVGNASADFSGMGLRVNGYVPLTKNLQIIGGLGVMSIKSSIKTSYEVNGKWEYGAEGNIYGRPSPFPATSSGYSTSTSTGGTYYDYSSDTDNLDGYSPVLSLGMIYDLTEHLSIRGELEWYGVPVDGLNIIATSAGVQYSF